MTVKELESQLLALTPAETAEAIEILSRSIDKSWRFIYNNFDDAKRAEVWY